ncbi:uroporphyrinogen-III synthase [Sphingomonas sp. Leaf407]|uniref:uroporphyrinogen-III synthase n=1 Tax=unclassified Sphingomonas TaxID=196159 RepID=UPI0006F41D2D|nr:MULTISPECIES: uroporphyrinogen-III synthase [unclassified Sphingomonas]KQN39530.1 uroporphyrinogen-III synthase [Sphingomonas sp. Leaf42]KQT28807.1 uroporphyrinogen-III synthase [Sphingomonas sp. Leaf407]
MSVPLAVLRPEPGNAATVAAIRALGGEAIALPLFAVVPLAWELPADGHDALVLTSANAVRHAGAGLAALAHLPVHAVGAATARAARDAGLRVVATGAGDGRTLLDAAGAAGVRRALLLTARDRAVAAHGVVATIRAVYAAVPTEPVGMDRLAGSVALVHSPRAAVRLAALVADRGTTAVAAISPAAAAMLGNGWRAVAVAAMPSDPAVIAAGLALAGD